MASDIDHSPVMQETDPVLAAAQRAPLVELTDHEKALLAEVEGRPVQWVVQEEFAKNLDSSADQQ